MPAESLATASLPRIMEGLRHAEGLSVPRLECGGMATISELTGRRTKGEHVVAVRAFWDRV